MGREAYRIGIKLSGNPAKEDVIKAFERLDAKKTNEGEFSDITMEILFRTEGYLEILLNNPAEHEAARNKIAYETGEIKSIPTPTAFDKLIVFMRFAKPNSVGIVDKIISLIKQFKQMIPIDMVKDFEANIKIDLDNYADFRERVLQAKQEFEGWHPKVEYPIRCRDVYKVILQKEGVKSIETSVRLP
ncbi:hypothetical protein [Acetonema longum]|uniref:AsnC family transcriptional regulator n=1 Tax=Acetonema longum DSM 6540 TaxID=1009370 RepID=F7NGF0_9FIRM|nr:hypothetical protein [Acetonema longum]EGO64882.1 AsnC family transcriptional regulator [Acetonema longum DSM 6540]